MGVWFLEPALSDNPDTLTPDKRRPDGSFLKIGGYT
jgi:hypothetical protein